MAILTAPTSSAERKGARKPDDDYFRRYQAAAWHCLGVVFVAERPTSEAARSWSIGARPERGDFDGLARAVESQLRADCASWTRTEDSREAEGLVRPSVHRALLAAGFRQSFKDTDKPQGEVATAASGGERSPTASASLTPSATRLGIPLSRTQRMSRRHSVRSSTHLGHADAMLYVRLRQGGAATNHCA